ncbi:MAG: hypothetical protein JXR96_08565 [Deltaproteobacteria bacterium]|nr:hypothetical protein [Deltaproteobacteria bacterium]
MHKLTRKTHLSRFLAWTAVCAWSLLAASCDERKGQPAWKEVCQQWKRLPAEHGHSFNQAIAMKVQNWKQLQPLIRQGLLEAAEAELLNEIYGLVLERIPPDQGGRGLRAAKALLHIEAALKSGSVDRPQLLEDIRVLGDWKGLKPKDELVESVAEIIAQIARG